MVVVGRFMMFLLRFAVSPPDAPQNIVWARHCAARTRGTSPDPIVSVSWCLPTASGCHFQERRVRYVAAFWGSAPSMLFCLAVRDATALSARAKGENSRDVTLGGLGVSLLRYYGRRCRFRLYLI